MKFRDLNDLIVRTGLEDLGLFRIAERSPFFRRMLGCIVLNDYLGIVRDNLLHFVSYLVDVRCGKLRSVQINVAVVTLVQRVSDSYISVFKYAFYGLKIYQYCGIVICSFFRKIPDLKISCHIIFLLWFSAPLCLYFTTI